jgi:fumarylacetoacetase
VAPGSDFPIQNLPFGVFHTAAHHGPRVGVAIGDHVLDLWVVSHHGLLPDDVALVADLSDVLGSPRRARRLRLRVADLLSAGNDELAAVPGRGLVPLAEAIMHVPFRIGDYVDFFSSLEHATNVGEMFRPDQPPLLPNWRHLPVGYHGRASTIVVSGTPVPRPNGQYEPPSGDPTFGPSTKLDFELEVGFFTGPGPAMGHAIPVDRAEASIAGIVLVNDWSARDLQAWEYRPLGPLLGKSFATTVSPWVVTLDALAPYRVDAPRQDPPPLPHLAATVNRGIDLHLEIELNGTVVGRTNFRHMYWTMAQQLAHVSSNGTRIRTGDLYASGTVSGPNEDEVGSLLERTRNGARPLTLADGSTRTFLEDVDTVVLRGWCSAPTLPHLGLGECRGTVTASPRSGIGPY